jgi:hypothetical protein
MSCRIIAASADNLSSSRLDVNSLSSTHGDKKLDIRCSALNTKMASLVRPAILKQGILSGSARRLPPSTAAALSTSSLTSIRPISASIHSRRTLQPKPRTVSIASRIAPFHSSASRNILPPGPQKIEGGVNDPAPVPPPHPTEGSYHWVFERL